MTRTDQRLSRERCLAAKLALGEPYDFAATAPNWTPGHGGWPVDRVVTAAGIRRLIVGDGGTRRIDARGLVIRGAVIEGKLDLRDVVVDFPLSLTNCRFTGPVMMERATLATLDLSGSVFSSEVDLENTWVRGNFGARSARFLGANEQHICFNGFNLRVDGLLGLVGITARGMVSLIGCRCRNLSLARSRLHLPPDAFHDTWLAADLPSLNADSIYVETNLSLEGVVAEGVIKAVSATIDGQLVADGLNIRSETWLNSSLNLIGSHIGGIVFLGVTAKKVVDISALEAGRSVTLAGASLTGEPSLQANGMKVRDELDLRDLAKLSGTVSLVACEIGSLQLPEEEAALPVLGDVTGWKLTDIHGAVRADRGVAARWLEGQQTAQPWQELARFYERSGQPDDARSINYRSAVRSSRSARGLSWVGRQAYRWTTGHGYYPLRSLLWLVAVFAIAWGISWIWQQSFTTPVTATMRAEMNTREQEPTGVDCGPARSDEPGASATGATRACDAGRVPASACPDEASAWDTPCLDPAGYAVSVAFPAGVAAQAWSPPPGAVSGVLFVLRLLAWVLTAFLVAGVTGLLRRQA